MVQKYINQGWPDSKNAIPLEVQPFWCVRDKLYISEGLVLRRKKLIVPNSLRRSMSKIHVSHLGIEKCTARAKDLFYWPGMSAQITEMCERVPSTASSSKKSRRLLRKFQIIRGKKFPVIYSLLTVSLTFLLGTISLNLSSTPNCRIHNVCLLFVGLV